MSISSPSLPSSPPLSGANNRHTIVSPRLSPLATPACHQPSTMADFEKDIKYDESPSHVEDIHVRGHADDVAALSGIEAEAASKAAWLITITVSLGGLLFGKTSPLIRRPLQEPLADWVCRI